MTPEQRAESLITSGEGISAIRHYDAFALQELIAAAIREAEAVAAARECERCATLAERIGLMGYADQGFSIAYHLRNGSEPEGK